MDNLLRDTLLALYRDTPEITEALLKCDYTRITRKYKEELFARISPDEFYKMDAILHSDEYIKYRTAVDQAAFACTEQLAQLIEFSLAEQEGGLN